MVKRLILMAFLFLLLCSCTSVGPAYNGLGSEGTSSPAAGDGVEIERDTTKSLQHLTSQESSSATLEPSQLASPTATLAPAIYFNFEPGINPLTGLPVADSSLLNRRPVMVKVSNWPREGRPHAGLTGADIVFEYFIGHQMNRFLAIYYGEDETLIGPVRSGRLVDAQLVNLYQGILAYGNADPQVDDVLVEELGERALAFNFLPCPAMCGEATHSATGVFANSGAITAYVNQLGVDNSQPDLRGMYFDAGIPLGDANGTLLRIEYADFSIMEWHFNPRDEQYNLWMEQDTAQGLQMMPMTDRNNGEPVKFDNVVVMYAEYIEYAPSLHDILIRDAVGYQPALLFRDGVITYGTWRVPEPDRPIIFETPEGAPLPFKPGKTWMVIVGMNSETSHPEAGMWKINFALP